MKPFYLALQIFFLASSIPLYAADLSTPAGRWMTVDDKSGKPGGLIRIELVDGQYQGWIEKIFPDPDEDPDPRCVYCAGARKNQPVVGLHFMWGLTRQGDEYRGGEILDPRSGKIYRARMKLEDGGKKLNVRGFIGFSLLGRSQVWQRAE
ncbi:MAG TPA: DUF2147 domain-containing protein [Verrucomicrobiae bacterium]|jgi:uncharacterized protein (DUF2147 family)|nr:DUF2147 domain-containing protein [Verrucomicrobiae bacterium]